eukprot:6791864-Lingulodinium_polyedra.AAC.3
MSVMSLGNSVLKSPMSTYFRSRAIRAVREVGVEHGDTGHADAAGAAQPNELSLHMASHHGRPQQRDVGPLGVRDFPALALDVRAPGLALLQADHCRGAEPVLERGPELVRARGVGPVHVERDEFRSA